MQVSKNELSGNTTITLDGFELSLVEKAVWDEQIIYYDLLKREKWAFSRQKQEWEEKLQHLNNMGRALGCNVVSRM